MLHGRFGQEPTLWSALRQKLSVEECPGWVKMRNTRKEQIISASPLSTDIIRHERMSEKCPTSGSEVARNHLHDAERYAMALQVHRGLPAIRKPFELNELRRQRRNDVAVSSLARIPDRFS